VYAKSLSKLRGTNFKAFILIFLITFSIFVFTSDGHRFTFDEALAQDQSIRIATLEPHPNYVQGESRIFFGDYVTGLNFVWCPYDTAISFSFFNYNTSLFQCIDDCA